MAGAFLPGEPSAAAEAPACGSLVPELDLDGPRSGRRERLPGGGVSVDEGALRRGDDWEHWVGGSSVVVERACRRGDENPDITGGAYHLARRRPGSRPQGPRSRLLARRRRH